MATPFAPPKPGSTPIIVPSVMPNGRVQQVLVRQGAAENRVKGSRFPWSVAQPVFERSFRHRYQEPFFEDQKGANRDAETASTITVIQE